MNHDGAIWFVLENGNETGPVTRDDLARKGIDRDTYVWRDGMADWKPAADVAELAQLFKAQPRPAKPPPAPMAAKKGATRFEPDPSAKGGLSEFNTSHFKADQLPASQDWSRLTIEHDPRKFNAGVSGYADAVAAALAAGAATQATPVAAPPPADPAPARTPHAATPVASQPARLAAKAQPDAAALIAAARARESRKKQTRLLVLGVIAMVVIVALALLLLR